MVLNTLGIGTGISTVTRKGCERAMAWGSAYENV